MRQKVSESLCELIQAQQQQPQTHSWNAKRTFICYLTNQQIPEATPKQSHLGTIKLGPVLENPQAAVHTSLSRVWSLHRVTTMLSSDLCTKAGSSSMSGRMPPSLPHTSIICNQMFYFSMHTEGKQQYMCVFLHCYFTLCYPQLQGHLSTQPLCFQPIPPNSCYTSEMCTHLGDKSGPKLCTAEGSERGPNPGSHSRTSLTQTTER